MAAFARSWRGPGLDTTHWGSTARHAQYELLAKKLSDAVNVPNLAHQPPGVSGFAVTPLQGKP
jgi:hypothetical protein